MKPAKSSGTNKARRHRRDAANRQMPKTTGAVKKKRRGPKQDDALQVKRSARAVPNGLASRSKASLISLATRAHVPKAKSLSRDQLIRAILKSIAGVAESSAPAIASAARRTTRHQHNGALVDRKRLDPDGPARRIRRTQDRIVTMVRDAFWLHVYWELSAATIQRTEAALGAAWYTAQPILRLLDVTAEDATNSSESVVRDIVIHGGVNNWYIDLDGKPRQYRVDVGYRTERSRFYTICKSNVVTPPKPGGTARSDNHFQARRAESERIFALSGGNDPQANTEALRKFLEEKFHRPLSAGSLSNYGSGALSAFGQKSFHFDMEAELIVYGRTRADARVMISGEPVNLREDGSFTLRFELPDGRQILPATAYTSDGVEERTIILAIERNTKELEPMIHDGQEQ